MISNDIYIALILHSYEFSDSDSSSHEETPRASMEDSSMRDEDLSDGNPDQLDVRRLEDLQRPTSQEHADFMMLDATADKEAALQAMADQYDDEAHVVQSEVFMHPHLPHRTDTRPS
jgi:hypothetical protein